jgi:hypothetical protein
MYNSKEGTFATKKEREKKLKTKNLNPKTLPNI